MNENSSDSDDSDEESLQSRYIQYTKKKQYDDLLSQPSTSYSNPSITYSSSDQLSHQAPLTENGLSTNIKQEDFDDDTFGCEYSGCTVRSATKRELTSHLWEHIQDVSKVRYPEMRYPCSVLGCTETFMFKGSLSKHELECKIKLEREEREVQKQQLEEATQKMMLIPNLIKKEVQPASEGCEESHPPTTQNMTDLSNQLKYYHESIESRLLLDYFAAEMAAENSLKRAVSFAPNEKPYQCQVAGCSSSYVSSGGLKAHMRFHLQQDMFTCPVNGCGKRYAQRINLDYHIKTHTGVKPFACQERGCYARFITVSQLKKHTLMHVSKQISSSSSYNSLAAAPLENGYYDEDSNCEPLNLSIPKKRELTPPPISQKNGDCETGGQNNKNGTYSEDVEAEEDSRKVVVKLQPGVHKKKELVLKVQFHLCEHCGKSFIRKNSWRRHMESHDPNRSQIKYRCTYEGCSKSYTEKRTLKSHVQTTHKGLFACPICRPRKRFTRNEDVEEHCLKCHGSSSGSKAFPISNNCQTTFPPPHNNYPTPKNKEQGFNKKSHNSTSSTSSSVPIFPSLPFKCWVPGCVAELDNVQLLEKHLISHAAATMVSTSSNNNDIKNKKKRKSLFSCGRNDCRKRYSSKLKLNQHIERSHNNAPS